MRHSSLPEALKHGAEGTTLSLTADARSAAAAALPASATAPTAPTDDAAAAAKAGVLAKRRAHLGPNLALFFEEDPLHMVRGSGCQLFDSAGNAYLDW